MIFYLFERKFKFVDDVLYSFYKKGRSTINMWHPVKLSFTGNGYLKFSFKFKGKTKTIKYHRVVYYANNPNWNIYDSSKYNVIDHIDQKPSNNHISNLRVVTMQENSFNKTCKGYSFNKAYGKYEAYIKLNSYKIHLGCYNTEVEARQAYLNKKKEIHIIKIRKHNF